MSLGDVAISEASIADNSVSDIAVATFNGNSATGTLSSPLIFAGATVSVTGLSATAALGTVEAFAEFIAEVSLPAMSSFLGTPVVRASAPVAIGTGVSATTSLDSVVVAAGAIPRPTTVSASGDLGTVVAPAAVTLTGVSAQVETFNLEPTGDSNLSLTGTSATSAINSVGVLIFVDALVTGIELNATLGTVTTTGSAVVSVNGVEARGGTSRPIVWGPITPNVNSTWTTIAAG